MSNEEANELWDEIGKRATVRSKAAAMCRSVLRHSSISQ